MDSSRYILLAIILFLILRNPGRFIERVVQNMILGIVGLVIFLAVSALLKGCS